ncbi:MAG: zinc-binding dehydrogenase [Streptosporangiales bacterium]|nr:zinc-binding dehydrogenase [Streptosporangiales bacterium]
MRAAYITEVGPAEAIRYGELPVPATGPTDVLVNVEAVAVNPVDTFIRSGAWPTPTPFPFVLGRDLVGRVAALGSGAVGFAVGDRVWCNSLGHAGRQGSFAECAVAPVERLYHLPDRADALTAVAVAHPAATAYLALFRHGGLRPGETLCVQGGAGNVGTAAIQLAAAAEARVIATANAADASWCRAAGAAEVLDYRDPALAERLRAVAPDGIEVYVDTSGRLDLDLAVDVLAFRGRIVCLAGLGQRPALPLGPLYTRDGHILGFVISRATADELADAARTINRLLAAGGLTTRISEVLPLERAAEAHRMVEDGVRGRVVLRI